MGNFTLLDYTERIQCSKNEDHAQELHAQRHILLQFETYHGELYHFPYFEKSEISRLRFITCGERGLHSIPFNELINIFDKWIWLLITLSTAAFLIPLRSLSELKFMRIPSHWISPLKLLLDQGNPFLESVASDPRMRVVVAGYLLMGLVLSNAYKNTNVYNMITPRQPVPYEFFRELIADNFKIYSRVTSLEASKYNDVLRLSQIKGSFYYQFTENGYVHVAATSEIAVFINNLESSVKTLYVSNISRETITNNSRLSTSGLLNTAILHPSVKTMVVNLNWRNPLDGIYMYKKTAVREKIILMKIESLMLSKVLRECDRVALLEPEYMCWDHRRSLKKESSLTNIFVGKESISDVQWLFTLKGTIPPHIPKRITGVHEAGIWRRWERLVMKSEEGDTNKSKVAAASMKGNVIIIFCVWVLGLIGGSIILLVEISRLCWIKNYFKTPQVARE